ncbi:lanthionine synthetase LanC family protein [Enterococcus sp. AZ109]|uniref:lanthionine synthetase LanC family protein n=1 Tax=Enterococcus sp. AZ109 TaxID=2774634 RepID=UPI003F688771
MTQLVVSIFSKRFGILNSYSKTINSLLLKRTYEFSQNRLGHDNVRTGDFDLIFGLSGVLYYLLDSTWDAKHDIIKLNKIGEFLVYITENTVAEDNNIPRYFVKETPAGNPSDSYADLGRAHGIISILIALTKFKKKGFIAPNLDISIDKLFEFYNNLYTNTYGWPITVYQSEFEMIGFRAIEKSRERESWCYGSASIAKGLIDSAINVSNGELVKKYYDILYELINVDLDTYMLDDYILCHGYSGLITVIESLALKSEDKMPYQYYLTNEIILNLEKKMKDISFKKLNLDILEGVSGQILALNYLNNQEMKYVSLLMLT